MILVALVLMPKQGGGYRASEMLSALQHGRAKVWAPYARQWMQDRGRDYVWGSSRRSADGAAWDRPVNSNLGVGRGL